MSMEKNEKIITLGYVPLTFPRDPIDVNYFEEHMILGQIIEPIIDTDINGNLIPGVADRWSFSSDGKKISFFIDKEKIFSNGMKVTSEDIAFSIRRHLLNPKSQSSAFLNDVDTINVINKNEISIQLKNANPSIIKALSRDHLGILPHGWSFDSMSDEPFIGTGPYRAIRIKNEWFLIENTRLNTNTDKPELKRLKLVFYSNNQFKIPNGPLPDILPDISERSLSEIENNVDFNNRKFIKKQRISFTQTSFWIYPKGHLFQNKGDRSIVSDILNRAVLIYCEEKKLKAATGMIPVGIQGYLVERKLNSNIKNTKSIKIDIAYLAGVFGDFFKNEKVLSYLNSNNIIIKLHEFTPVDLNKLKVLNPDIVTGSWAGGFNDPVGFMGLLTPLLGLDFSQYLKSENIILDNCTKELDWNKRAICFRNLTEKLVTSGLNIPGWRSDAYFISKPEIYENNEQLRYTSRFVNFRLKK